METIDFTPHDIIKEVTKIGDVSEISLSKDLLKRLTNGLHKQKGNPFDNYFDYNHMEPSRRGSKKVPVGYMFGMLVLVDTDLIDKTLILTGGQTQMRFIVRDLPCPES